MREADVIRAAVRVLHAVTHKQLMGERGIADEMTEAYRDALLLALNDWIDRFQNVRLDDFIQLNFALDELQAALEEVAIDQTPIAFEAGSDRLPSQEAEFLELGVLLNTNQQFLIGSLIPYFEEELTSDDPFQTVGGMALERKTVWETRVGLYTGVFWSAIWLGAGASLREQLELETVPVRRLLDPAAKHCPTCPPKAREYPSWNAMLAFTGGLPADGSDDCVSNCRCQIQIKRGDVWVSVI